jgi:mannitol/fructose-specific phosphotransferase system IIA component (Ntr-type)
LLTALLPPERIRVPLGSHSRHALFRELVELALPDADPATLETVFQSVLQREAVVSTAIGDGVAVPHGRTNAVSGLCMAAGLVESVDDYQAPDGIPVTVCFLMVTPEADAGLHLKALAGIARMMRNVAVRNALHAVRTADEFAAAIARAETP